MCINKERHMHDSALCTTIQNFLLVCPHCGAFASIFSNNANAQGPAQEGGGGGGVVVLELTDV